MATVTKPVALDESLNTTDSTPKNIADVLKDKLGDIANAISGGGGGSGGHTIQNASGANMPQEPTMQFTDCHVSDDSANEKTVIENIKSVTEAQFESATEDGLYDVDVEGTEIGEISEDYVEVEADGTKTWATLLNELYEHIDATKISQNSLLVVDFIAYKIVCVLTYTTSAEYQFSKATISSGNKLVIDKFVIKSANSTYGQKKENVTISDRTSQQATSGIKISLYYGNDKAVVDLQTTANRCLMSDGRNVEAVLDGIGTITETVSASLTINANSWGASAISPTIPTGYHIKSISAYSTHLALAGASVAFTGNQYQVYAYNIASGERTGGVYATFVYEKN